jgi:hypothetical protein
MPRKLFLAGALLALAAGPAAAQFPAPSLSLDNGPKQLTPGEKAKQKELDDAYKAATRKIPSRQQTADPWGDIRPDPATAASRR